MGLDRSDHYFGIKTGGLEFRSQTPAICIQTSFSKVTRDSKGRIYIINNSMQGMIFSNGLWLTVVFVCQDKKTEENHKGVSTCDPFLSYKYIEGNDLFLNLQKLQKWETPCQLLWHPKQTKHATCQKSCRLCRPPAERDALLRGTIMFAQVPILNDEAHTHLNLPTLPYIVWSS